jgi:hypothetical protein
MLPFLQWWWLLQMSKTLGIKKNIIVDIILFA